MLQPNSNNDTLEPFIRCTMANSHNETRPTLTTKHGQLSQQNAANSHNNFN